LGALGFERVHGFSRNAFQAFSDRPGRLIARALPACRWSEPIWRFTSLMSARRTGSPRWPRAPQGFASASVT
jgi:hypothetical protein